MARGIDRVLLGALTASVMAHVAVIVSPAWELPDDSEDRRTRIEARLAAPVLEPARQASLVPGASPAAAPVQKARPKPRRKPVAPATPQVPAASLGSPPASEPSHVAAAESPVVDPVPVDSSPATRDAAGSGENGPPEPVGAAVEGSEVSDSQEKRKAEAPVADRPQAGGPTADVALPRAARIAFSLILGGLQVGEALQTWQRDEHGYRLRIVMETTGAARLFKALTITQTSAGEFDAGGLRPQSFIYEQTGRNTANSTFDWAQMKLTLEQGDNRREFPLDPGAQDLLSLAYHLGFAQGARQATVSVASGKNYNRHNLEWVGEETVVTPAGEVRALHVRTVGGDQTTEFWVAPQLRNLPVRIMFTDRKGTATQLIAHDVEADGLALLRRTETTEKK
jgi:hypothetical protein